MKLKTKKNSWTKAHQRLSQYKNDEEEEEQMTSESKDDQSDDEDIDNA